MLDDETEILALAREARSLPRGPTRVSLYEEAVRRADQLNNARLGYDLRLDLVDAAMFTGRSDLVLVAYAWCLAEFDRDSSRHREHNLLWMYKWVVYRAPDFPEISRRQIDDLLADMEARFRRGGHSLHAVRQHRRFARIRMGDADGARAEHTEFLRTFRDRLSDCAACVPSEDVAYHAFVEDWAAAIDAAQPVLRGGLTCAEEPRKIQSRLLLPLLRTGRRDEAQEHHRAGYRALLRAEHAVDEASRHLVFVTLSGHFAKARKMLERHFPAALAAVTPDLRFEFFLAAKLLVERLRATGAAALKLRIPDPVPPPDVKGRHDLAQLSDWLTREAQAIAHRYDARNGNPHFRRQVEALPRLLELAWSE